MTRYSDDFTPIEMMVVAASREIVNGQKLLIGSQWPVIVAELARRTHAPDIITGYEGGLFRDVAPSRVPLMTADPCLVPESVLCNDIIDSLGMTLHAGRCDMGLVTAANIDKYGNLNTTCAGNYKNPNFRFGGSGGACDFACLAPKLLIVLEHERHRFQERVDFITSPGYIDGYDSRERKGLRMGTGPTVVITTLGRFHFDEVTKEMYLDGYYHGVTIEEIKDKTGWPLKVASHVTELEPPTREEIRILRDEVDPERMYLGDAKNS